MIASQKNTQAISQLFIVQPFTEVFFFSDELGSKYCYSKYTKCNYKRAENMIAYTLIQIAFIKVYQRFSDAATGAGKTRKHFKRAKRLVCF